MAFARELYRAAQGGIEIFMVHGNHDPGEAWRADIPLPETVHIFPADQVTSIPLMKDGEKAATIYGISYKTRHVKENLAKEFHRERMTALPSACCIPTWAALIHPMRPARRMT